MVPGSNRAFLGTGWNFPVRAVDGHTLLVEHEEDIRQSILVILLTDGSERIMRPDFGAGLQEFVFEPVNPTTMAALGRRVRESLVDFELRIDVLDVSVSIDPNRPGGVLIDIQYRVRSSNAVQNFVYPFYLGEASR